MSIASINENTIPPGRLCRKQTFGYRIIVYALVTENNITGELLARSGQTCTRKPRYFPPVARRTRVFRLEQTHSRPVTGYRGRVPTALCARESPNAITLQSQRGCAPSVPPDRFGLRAKRDIEICVGSDGLRKWSSGVQNQGQTEEGSWASTTFPPTRQY